MKKILIVDDSEFTRKLIVSSLKNEKYHLIEASNGKEAIKKYKSEKPNLILLDVVISKQMSGIDVLKKIKKDSSQAKVIMVSVMDQPKILMETKKIGADGYISKPIEAEELKASIKKCLSS